MNRRRVLGLESAGRGLRFCGGDYFKKSQLASIGEEAQLSINDSIYLAKVM